MRLFIFFAALILTASCEKIILSDFGELNHVRVDYNYFSQVSIEDIFNVELRSDSTYSLEIETFDKFLDNISVSLDSGNLHILDNNSWKWLPDYPNPTIRIAFPRLDNLLSIEAPVKLTTPDTLRVPWLQINSLGKTGEFSLLVNINRFQLTSGSDNNALYRIEGKADSARFWPRGSSIIEASGLKTNSCYVYNNSIGDCAVSVSEKLEVRLNSRGNIYYYGNPVEIEIIEESNTGKLIKAGK